MFTEPAIYPKNPKTSDLKKTWRVWFRFLHGGKFHQVSRKYDLNTIKDFKTRLSTANIIKRELKNRLQKGWNPITNTYPDQVQKKRMDLPNALDFAFNHLKKEWSHKTAQDYSSKIKYIKNAVVHLGLDKLVNDYNKTDFKNVLETTIELRGLGANGYNQYRSFLSSLVAEMVEWELLEDNFIRLIKTKKIKKTIAHRPPTQDERLVIISRIKEINYPYYRFLCVLYGCGIRPVEISRLRVKHLHKLEGLFRLPAGITKNGVESDVAIPDWVMDLLMELKMTNPEDFIFGKGFEPGAVKLSTNCSHNTWRKIVKEGLKLDVNQYGLKKLSADDLVRLQRREGAGNLLGLAKEHFRHHSEEQTKIYTGEHENIYREIIQKKMPVL